jgi:hypothetical protein
VASSIICIWVESGDVSRSGRQFASLSGCRLSLTKWLDTGAGPRPMIWQPLAGETTAGLFPRHCSATVPNRRSQRKQQVRRLAIWRVGYCIPHSCRHIGYPHSCTSIFILYTF